MTCNDCDSLLLEYAYEELAAAPRREVEAHLPGCERCKHALAELQGTLLQVRLLPVEQPSAAGVESLLAFAETAARRHREERAPRRAAGLLPPWLSTLLFKPGFAVAAVAVVVGVASLSLSGVISFGGSSQAPSSGERAHESARPFAAPVSAPAPATAAEEPAKFDEWKKEEAVATARPAAEPVGSIDAPELAAALARDDPGAATDRSARLADGEGERQELAKAPAAPRPAPDDGRFDPRPRAPAKEESKAADRFKDDSGLLGATRKGGGAPAEAAAKADRLGPADRSADKAAGSFADLDDALDSGGAGVGHATASGRGAAGLREADGRGPAGGKAGALGTEGTGTAPSQSLQAVAKNGGVAGEPAPGSADARELEQSERFLKSRSARATPPPAPPPAAIVPAPKVAVTKHAEPAADPSPAPSRSSGGSATLGAPAPTAAAQAAPVAATPTLPSGGSPAAGYFGGDSAEESRDELAVAAGGARRDAPHGAPVVRKTEDLAKEAKDSKERRVAAGSSSMSNAINEIDQAEALFREAERLSGAERKAEAVKIFLRVAREYPSTLRARQALYSAWLIELDRGNDAAAGALLAELAQRYPGSQELQRARSRNEKNAEEKRVEMPSAKKKAAPPRAQKLEFESDYNQAPAAAAPEPAAPPAKAAAEQAY